MRPWSPLFVEIGSVRPFESRWRRVVSRRLRPVLLAANLLATTALVITLQSERPAPPRADTVVFIVLDTVRAESTSLCGYDLPTTPFLERMVEVGASYTCELRTPGSWTLPTHASYFTGRSLEEHGVHLVSGGPSIHAGPQVDFAVQPLPPDAVTLAEEFRAKGYQTVAVSANPLVSEATGLAQGFDVMESAPAFGAFFGTQLPATLRQVLRQQSVDDRPLFLFVNIADAHHPWLPIEVDHPFLPPRAGWDGFFHEGNSETWRRLALGEMPAVEEAELLAYFTDLYDAGVARADWGLKDVLQLLEQGGWLGPRARVVITSDHGEALGEHGFVGHTHFVWEPLVQVPVLFWSSEAPVTFPDGPLAGLVVHDLVRDGALPDPLPPVTAAALPGGPVGELFQATFDGDAHLARWQGSRKETWHGGRLEAYDLDADPAEEAPLPMLEMPQDLARMHDVLRARWYAESTTEPEVLELLKAAGYVE